MLYRTVEVLEGGPALGPGAGPGAVPAAQRVVPRGRHGAAGLPAPHQHLNTNMQSNTTHNERSVQRSFHYFVEKYLQRTIIRK